MQTPSNTRSDGHDTGIKPVTSFNEAATVTPMKATSAASHEFHSFITDIEDLIKMSTSLTGEDLERAKQKLTQRVAQARESIEKVGATVSDRARRSAEATDGYVHAKPWQAIGIGAAFGVLLGVVIARRGD